MSTSFDISAFDPAAFEIDQTITPDVAVMNLTEQASTVAAGNAPLVGFSEKFLVVGVKLDPESRRYVLILEQIIFSPDVVVALIFDERWEAGLQEPNRLVFSERWEPTLDEPETLMFVELWPPQITDLVNTPLFDERWEN